MQLLEATRKTLVSFWEARWVFEEGPREIGNLLSKANGVKQANLWSSRECSSLSREKLIKKPQGTGDITQW